MKNVLLLGLVVLVCSVSRANEQSVENATSFLKSLTEIKSEICREVRYRVLAGPALIGSATLSIQKSKFDSIPCYLVSWHTNLRVGDKWQTNETSAYVSHEMVCLYYARSSRDETLTTKTSALCRVGQKYTFVKTLNDGSMKSDAFEECERLILYGAEDLVPLLLPLDAPARYDFNDHSGKWGYTGRSYQVFDTKEHGSLKGTRIRHTYFNANDEKNQLDPADYELLVNKEQGLIRVSRNDGKYILELDNGDTSPETFRQYARPIDPVLAFWHGVIHGDSEMLDEAINEERYMDEVWDHDPKFSKLTTKEREAAKKRIKGTLGKGMVKSVELSEREKALLKAINSDDLDIKYENSSRVKVKLNDHYRKRSGDKSEMFWIVELDEDSGKWKFVWMATEDDEF